MIETKVMFMSGLERQLASMITAADLSRVMSAVADQLAEYSMMWIQTADGSPDDLLQAYLDAMQVQGRSDQTVERYRYIITRMMQAVGVPTRSITVHHLRRYLAEEKERGLADSTLEGVRQVFSAYFGWLQRERLIDVNPVSNLGAIKCQRRIRQVLSDVDIERLKAFCQSKRDRAIITFLSATGCRIGEVCRLDRHDVNLMTLECRVIGKGDKERTVYLDPVSAMHLKEYLKTRTDKMPALFIGRGSERLRPGGVRAMLQRVADAAGVDGVHPHKFRRTLATNLIRHGMPIQEVAAILGHDKLDTTMEYVVLDQTDVKNAYRKYA